MSGATQQTGGISPDVLARYEPVIGLEVHLQLKTASKIFCSCSTRFGDAPNANTCPVCLGLPGALPVLNRGALELAIRAALALHCTIQERSRFARKNYFYPDLPKGYQISMYEMPLATSGWLEIPLEGATKRIGITRLHMEDDAAKNLHEGFSDSDRNSYIDFNRCGVPLVEIVSEPDIRSPEEAYAYLIELEHWLRWFEVSDCDMELGSLRCDTNVSVRRRGARQFGVKVEVKNLNSFHDIQSALGHEIKRQIGVLESGGRIEQETRLWNVATRQTEPMRSKEFAHDYRYFPEPDLLPVRVSEAWKEQILTKMPEWPDARRARILRDFQITPYDVGVLTESRGLADYFEAAVKAGAPPKSAANWIQTELLRRLNDAGKDITESPVNAAALAELIEFLSDETISGKQAKYVFRKMFESGISPRQIIDQDGLAQIRDEVAIESVLVRIFASNLSFLDQYHKGKEGIRGAFVAEVMKATHNQANPQTVQRLLNRILISWKMVRSPGTATRTNIPSSTDLWQITVPIYPEILSLVHEVFEQRLQNSTKGKAGREETNGTATNSYFDL